MKKNIFYPAFAALMIFPMTVFAEEAGHVGGDFGNYLAEHWHDLSTLLFILPAIFAFRTSFLYGGIIGKALNLLGIGLLIEAAEEVFGALVLHLIAAEGSSLHYVLDVVHLVGVLVIAFAFWRLYEQTALQLGLNKGKK